MSRCCDVADVSVVSQVNYLHRVEEFPYMSADEQVGWIADDVEKLFPDLVTKDESGYKGVAYSRAVVLLTQAFQEYVQQTESRLQRLEEQASRSCSCN